MVAKRAAGAFYGQIQKRCEAAGLTFAESVYTAETQLQLPLHTHENAYLYFVVAGACEERYGRTTRLVDTSTLVFHPAGEPHSNRWTEAGGRAFHIEFSSTRVATIRQYAPFQNRLAEFRTGTVSWLAARLYREYQRPDAVSLLVMEGLALEIAADISRHRPDPDRAPPQWVLRARDLLHDRFAESLSLNEIATAAGVHPVHLARVFRHHFGCTPGDYLRRVRVEAACRQLAETDTPLVEIAFLVGFADQSHLTKTFRRLMRMTPGEFRRTARPR